MARTQLTSTNIGQVQRNDLDTTTSGEAVVTKVIKSGLIESAATGVDAGTGDVTLSTKLDPIVSVQSGDAGIIISGDIEQTGNLFSSEVDDFNIISETTEINATSNIAINTPALIANGMGYMYLETATGSIEDDGGSLILSHNTELSLNTSGKVTAANVSALDVGHSTSHASALLNVQSTTKGILIPKMTSAQRIAISSPSIGLLVYQTDGEPETAGGTEGLYQNLSSGWERVGSGGGSGGGSSLIMDDGDIEVDPVSKIMVGYGLSMSDLGSGEVQISNNLSWEYDDLDLFAYQAMGSTIKAQTVGLKYQNEGSFNSTTLTDNRTVYVAVYLGRSWQLNGVKFYQRTQGNYTADQTNQVALYSYSGGTLTRVAQSANNGNLWKGTANTLRSEAFTSTYNATMGLYVIGFVWNASATTTAPSISAGRSLNNANEATMDFTNSASLVARGTGNSMPSSVAYSALAVDVTRPWVALY